MNFVGAWLRLELARRWRSLAVLTLLIAVASGTVMAAVAGARRGASALERLQERTLPATSAVFTNTANFDWDKIRALPEVEALTTFVIDYTFSFEGYSEGVGGFPPADAETLSSIEKPVVFEGRMFDPARADEVVVTRVFAAHHHKNVGDAVVLNLPTPQAAGRTVRVRSGWLVHRTAPEDEHRGGRLLTVVLRRAWRDRIHRDVAWGRRPVPGQHDRPYRPTEELVELRQRVGASAGRRSHAAAVPT